MIKGMTRRLIHLLRLDGYFCVMAWVLAALLFINRLNSMVKLFMALYLRQELGLAVSYTSTLAGQYDAGADVHAADLSGYPFA